MKWEQQQFLDSYETKIGIHNTLLFFPSLCHSTNIICVLFLLEYVTKTKFLKQGSRIIICDIRYIIFEIQSWDWVHLNSQNWGKSFYLWYFLTKNYLQENPHKILKFSFWLHVLRNLHKAKILTEIWATFSSNWKIIIRWKELSHLATL